MWAYFLGDFGAEWKSIASYATERQVKSVKKEATVSMKDKIYTYYRLNLNTYLK